MDFAEVTSFWGYPEKVLQVWLGGDNLGQLSTRRTLQGKHDSGVRFQVPSFLRLVIHDSTELPRILGIINKI